MNPPLPPPSTVPPDAQAVIRERQAEGRPLLPPVIQFLNEDRTLCYSNAGSNFLLSSPKLVEFLLSLPPGEGLVEAVRQLALTPPMTVGHEQLHIIFYTIYPVTDEVNDRYQAASRPGGTCCRRLSFGGNPPRCTRMGGHPQGGHRQPTACWLGRPVGPTHRRRRPPGKQMPPTWLSQRHRGHEQLPFPICGRFPHR